MGKRFSYRSGEGGFLLFDGINMSIYVLGIILWLQHVSRCDKVWRTGSWDGTKPAAQHDRPDASLFAKEKGMSMDALVNFAQLSYEWIEREAAALQSYFFLQGVSLLISIFRLFKMVRFQPELNIVCDTLLRTRTNMFSFASMFFATTFLFACCVVFLFGTQSKAFNSILMSFRTLMLWLFGELAVDDMSITEWIRENVRQSNPAAMLFFLVYMLFVFYILLGMLIAIIFASFEAAEATVQTYNEQTHDSLLAQVGRAFQYPLRHLALRELEEWLKLESKRVRYCNYLRLHFLAGMHIPKNDAILRLNERPGVHAVRDNCPLSHALCPYSRTKLGVGPSVAVLVELAPRARTPGSMTASTIRPLLRTVPSPYPHALIWAHNCPTPLSEKPRCVCVAEADLSPRAVHEMVAMLKRRQFYVRKPDFKHDADGSEPHTRSAGHKTAGQVEDPEPDWPLMHRWLQKAAEQPKCAIFSFGLRLGGSAVACTPNSH